ncbi:hypothetical protein L6452_33462 [Arctium lappa]|uniref:Uncharacterized protein n=1 Tax=Arctium lappa TaxID=4217 RepID=A0ACB8YG59_ARCLA|nr:hypothetical protein L6452_33462 [Arctium lappa]
MDCEADRETTRFKNFPIREFVASVREKDPEKCWPFASLCAYKNFDESISLVNLNISEDAEAPELSEGEISEGKEAGTDTPTGFEHEILEGNETGSDTATGSELETSKGKETATAKAIELQISKGKNTGFETAAGNTGNVNSKSIIDTEDDSDDDTLGLFLKKRKGVKITRGARNKKKQKRHQVEKPRPKAVKRPNLGPEGSRVFTKKPKPAYTRNDNATGKLADTLRPVEVETPMARRKKSKTPVAGPPGSERGVVLTGSGAGGSKGPAMGVAAPCDGRFLKIMVNRNPADFSAPEAGNRFMRKGYSE